MECRGCGGGAAAAGELCARCLVRARHGARRLRDLIVSLVDERVLFVIDELSDRLRTAGGYEQLLERFEAELAAVAVEEDGWALEGEVSDVA